jgi:(S)-3,5-dihydroxyphenylglycine transaminase
VNRATVPLRPVCLGDRLTLAGTWTESTPNIGFARPNKDWSVSTCVIYLATFSRTLFPGLRLGDLVADQTVGNTSETLAERLSKIKSSTTLNTSPLLQAAAATLHYADGSLRSIVAQTDSRGIANASHRNRPRGGFFIHVVLPFALDESAFLTCAERYGVICLPVSMSSLHSDRQNSRLSFSTRHESRSTRA